MSSVTAVRAARQIGSRLGAKALAGSTQIRSLTSLASNLTTSQGSIPSRLVTPLVHKPRSVLESVVETKTPFLIPLRNLSDVASLDNANVAVNRMRNIAVIAHVDHGKTTMVDSLLKSSGTRMNAGEVRLMDSNQLERERGITILAKCTSIVWNDARKKEDLQINIVDTPGHADFGGEVERILTMVDGVTLIVDATEGPMAQTKFVLKKALGQGLKPIVVINKVDRPTARLGEVENEIFDLFVTLDATDEQLEYPVLYASGRSGWASKTTDPTDNMDDLFQAIVDHVPPPPADPTAPFQMLVSQIESDTHFGKCLIGRIKSGTVKVGDSIKALDEKGGVIETSRVLKILRRRGMNRFTLDQAIAGDIVSIAGFSTATVNTTLNHPTLDSIIPSIPIDPPTLSMSFEVNNSPLAGRDGSALTLLALKQRLLREAENNVSIRVLDSSRDCVVVRARGELQLGVIIETIRREGSEVAVSPPQVVFRKDEQGNRLEPLEEVTIDVDEPMSGTVIEKLSKRKGEMKEYISMNDGRVRLIFHIPTRGLLGYRSEFTNDTRGQGVMNQSVLKYVPYMGKIDRSDKGAIISMESGTCTAYALEMAEARGVLFVEPNTAVYPGMVIGEHSRAGDCEFNPAKAKALTNVRSVMKDDKTRLVPPKKMSLEEMISYVRDDEMIEVTPNHVRLRKRILDANARKSAAKRTTWIDEE